MAKALASLTSGGGGTSGNSSSSHSTNKPAILSAILRTAAGTAQCRSAPFPSSPPTLSPVVHKLDDGGHHCNSAGHQQIPVFRVPPSCSNQLNRLTGSNRRIGWWWQQQQQHQRIDPTRSRARQPVESYWLPAIRSNVVG